MKEFTSTGTKLQMAAERGCAPYERKEDYHALYVGMDVHKDSIALGSAWPGRGEAEYRGEIASSA